MWSGWWRWVGSAARLTAKPGSGRDGFECSQRVEDRGEGVGPGPARRESQGGLTGAVDEAAGQCEESGADGARNDEPVGVVTAQAGGPTHHVVREDRDLEPRRVRPEHTRREVLESGSGLEVLDRQLDGGVLAMEPIDFDDVAGQVGEERVVAPVGPQLLLGAAGEDGCAGPRDDASPSSFPGRRCSRIQRLGLRRRRCIRSAATPCRRCRRSLPGPHQRWF